MLNLGIENFLGVGAYVILRVKGDLFCSPNDLLAKSLGVWGTALPATVESINFLRSCSA